MKKEVLLEVVKDADEERGTGDWSRKWLRLFSCNPFLLSHLVQSLSVCLSVYPSIFFDLCFCRFGYISESFVVGLRSLIL